MYFIAGLTQNNLDELYAVVNFTVPGYLGSLDEFQRKFAKIIAAGNDPEASIQAVSKVNEMTQYGRRRN